LRSKRKYELPIPDFWLATVLSLYYLTFFILGLAFFRTAIAGTSFVD
jgi:hypothetical protein